MFKIDPDYFYTIEEIEKSNICSKSTLYRRHRAKEITMSKSISGETVIKGDELIKYMKKHPVQTAS